MNVTTRIAGPLLGVLLASACGSGGASAKTATPSPTPTVDRAAVATAQELLTKLAAIRVSMVGHTKGFSGRDESNLAELGSQYQLAAADLRAASAGVGPAKDAVATLSDALGAIATCISGSAGDYFISSVKTQCPDAYAAVQERTETARAALALL